MLLQTGRKHRERLRVKEVRMENTGNSSMVLESYYFQAPLLWSVSMVAFVASIKVLILKTVFV